MATHWGHLELEHFIRGCRGFLVDVTAMEGFLKLLKKALEDMSAAGEREGHDGGGAGPQEAEAASLGCSVTPETFESRRQGLSKRIAEAQWRLQIVTSNQGVADGELRKNTAHLLQVMSDLPHFCRFRKRHARVGTGFCSSPSGTQQELQSEEEEKSVAARR